MIEMKLIVGSYYQIPRIAAQIQYVDGDFLTQPTSLMTLQQSTRRDPGSHLNPFRNQGGQRLSVAVAGANPVKPHRNFQWLAWYPGAVSQVPINGTDVLTGPMSGCWVMIYRWANAEHVGHVGTAEPNSAKTIAVKAAWNQFAQNNQAAVIAGFKPNLQWANRPASIPGDHNTYTIYGLVTSAHQFYSIFAYKQESDLTMIRIAGIEGPIATTGLHDLSNI